MQKWILTTNLVLLFFTVILALFSVWIVQTQRDELVSEIKKATSETAMVASNVADEIFKEYTREIVELSASCLKPSGTIQKDFSDAEKNSDSGPFGESFFLFDLVSNLKFPKLGELRDKLTVAEYSQKYLKQFATAETLELKGEGVKAYDLYQKIEQMSESSNERAFARFALARIEKKSGNPEKALTLYEKLKKNFPNTISPDGLNLEAMTSFEVICIILKNGKTEQAFAKARDFNRAMYGRLDIAETERNYFRRALSKVFKNSSSENAINYDAISNKFDKIIQTKKGILNDIKLLVSKLTVRVENKQAIVKIIDKSRFLILWHDDNGFGCVVKLRLPAEEIFLKELNKKLSDKKVLCDMSDCDGQILFSTRSLGENRQSKNVNSKDFPIGSTIETHFSGTGGIKDFSAKGILPNLIMVGVLFSLILMFFIANLKMMLKQLEISKLKTNFISAVSHEMRLPLSTIKTANEMFISGKADNVDKAKKYNNYIETEVDRLEHLISNVLNLSRIESGKMEYHFEETSLTDIMEKALCSILSTFEKDGFRVEKKFDSDTTVLIDEKFVLQAILNLLDNARKYSGESRTIQTAIHKDHEYAYLDVIDFGVGIEKKNLKKIYGMFFREGDELTRKTKGVGLGLTITREVMEKHNGKVSVVSEKGKGTTFTLVFPLINHDDKC